MKHNDVLEQLEYFRTLWTKAMPGIPPPADEQIISWIGEFSAKIVTHGILRTQRKFRTQVIEPAEYWRYAGGVMANESRLHTAAALSYVPTEITHAS